MSLHGIDDLTQRTAHVEISDKKIKIANYVKAYMSPEEVGAQMDIDEYLDSLVTQVTNLSFTFTKATLLAKLKEGHANIAAEMKNATKYVV